MLELKISLYAIFTYYMENDKMIKWFKEWIVIFIRLYLSQIDALSHHFV
jgi:hypothetical protein